MESQRLGNQDASSRTKIRKYRHIDLFFPFYSAPPHYQVSCVVRQIPFKRLPRRLFQIDDPPQAFTVLSVKISRVKGLFVSIQPFSYKYYLVLRKI